ncbi:MAG: MarR family transcriptional regulator [Gammaproteobacteria bacterium]|nr:MarR family transcriptional regulator [Gammaproteobacteria bacterium]MBP6050994.1 MarR family transcriptional regulator [Pseudomonadales bacterium]MBK6582501.1 MarR family transcriptional regulator [Gammaproteobacteria bacterium]MBK7169646.1 MarR family transcriptional regulator [Gammaproteobacteria bacterium]MBK7521231.1 MarR family transcriptional regulator [Gammaproteobacteria bacterium]
MARRGKLTQEDLDFYKSNNIGQALIEVARDYQKSALDAYAKVGHGKLQASHQSLLLHLGLEGARMTDLAERAGVSKQTMGQIIDEVEALGYVERTPAPYDRRAKIIKFTDKGIDLIKIGTIIGENIQQRYAQYIGPKMVTLLHKILVELRSNIHKHSS